MLDNLPGRSLAQRHEAGLDLRLPCHLGLSPLRKHFDQVPQFVINVGRIGNGLGQFGADEFAEAFAEAVNCDFDRAFVHIELGRGRSL